MSSIWSLHFIYIVRTGFYHINKFTNCHAALINDCKSQ